MGIFLIPNKRSAPAPKFIIIIIIIIIGNPTQLFLSDYSSECIVNQKYWGKFCLLWTQPQPFLLVLVKENVTQSSLAAGLWSFFKNI